MLLIPIHQCPDAAAVLSYTDNATSIILLDGTGLTLEVPLKHLFFHLLLQCCYFSLLSLEPVEI